MIDGLLKKKEKVSFSFVAQLTNVKRDNGIISLVLIQRKLINHFLDSGLRFVMANGKKELFLVW